MNARSRVLIAFGAIAWASLAGGCTKSGGTSAASTSTAAATPATSASTAVDEWMLCEECISGERDRVIAFADTAVPPLRFALLTGPRPVDMARFRRLVGLVGRSTPLATADSLAREAEITDVIYGYRRRSADALAAIGGDSAHAALCAARVAVQSTSLRYALDSSIARTGGACP